MNKWDLIPSDSLTQRILIDILLAMYKHEKAFKNAVATSEFTRPDAATADTQSVQTDMQSDSTTVIVSGQNNEKARAAPVTQRSSKR